jgi:EmrB/QacA subfamily drug resistance transporter
MATVGPTQVAERTGPVRPALVLAICCLSLLIVGVDNTIVNVALPAIGRGLHASVSRLQWTVDAYQLFLGALLVAAGSAADRFGRRRILRIGLALFTFASLLCSLAPSISWLIGFRVVQAVGAAMMNPVAMAIVTEAFPDPTRRARAFGIWSAVYGASMAVGPVVGGLAVGGVGWRSIFWINIPIGVAAIGLVTRFVPESRAAKPRRLDPLGQLLVIVMLATLMYAIIEGPATGWSSPAIVVLFVLAVASLALLLNYELRRSEPLIDPRFFRSIPLSGATLIALCGFAAIGGFLFVNTLYLQDALRFSALRAGLYTLPIAITTMLFAPLSGRLAAARGARVPLAAAGIGITASALLLTGLNASTPHVVLFASYAVLGVGFGMLNAPITSIAVTGMPAAQTGVAAAVASTGRQTGQAIGVAAIGVAVAAQLHTNGHVQLATATHVAWWIIAGCGMAVLAGAVASTTPRARRSVGIVAAQLEGTGVIGVGERRPGRA